jgi:hypothetical protein
MNEKKKHKIMLGIEVVLLCMIVAILGTNAASSNPPSNGVSYGKNNQTTVEGALNDLYTKANYGNASASQILKDKTALVGGSKVTGTMPNNLSGTASSVITYENSLYYRIPAGYYGGLGWGSEISATYADVASAIGLTAGKLLKGQTVLGITGTGETTCPTCESQGYWKTYSFKVPVTEVYNRETLQPITIQSGTWKKLHDGCHSASGSYNDTAVFCASIGMNFDSKEILMKNIDLRGIYSSSNANSWDDSFRISRGYSSASSSATAQYWYLYSINNLFVLTNSLDSSSSCTASVSIDLKGDKLCFSANMPLSTRTNKFELDGTIIYK